MPRPVLLASWVGYDTDGRTDIGWWDTLRLRLTMKRLQLERLHGQLAPLGACAAPLAARVGAALAAVEAQIAAVPEKPEPQAVERLAAVMVGEREAALTGLEPLLSAVPAALAAAPDDATRLALAVSRAGLAAHGLALAQVHVRAERRAGAQRGPPAARPRRLRRRHGAAPRPAGRRSTPRWARSPRSRSISAR